VSSPYTQLLGTHSGTGNLSDFPLQVAPVGFVTVVRDITIMVAATSPQTCGLYWISGSGVIFLLREQIGSSGTFHRDLRQVLPAGQTLYWSTSGDQHTIAITGYLLTDTAG